MKSFIQRIPRDDKAGGRDYGGGGGGGGGVETITHLLLGRYVTNFV